MYDTDEEQVEALKKWWQANGNTVITAVIIFLVAYFGLTFYRSSVQQAEEAAGSVYQQVLDVATAAGDLSDENRGQASELIAQLKSDHEKSIYAQYGALYAAKFAAESGDLDQAVAELQWALDRKPDANLEKIIRLRMARVIFAQGEAEDALKAIEGVEPGEHLASYEEFKGDVYLAQGNQDQARTAYAAAMDAAKEKNLNRPVLEMKLNDLAVAN